MVGQNIGKYRVLDRVGRGGMGTVYRALDETLHREVAIKVLNAELNDPEVAKRFRAEAITVARLNHPGIATIYELFQYDGQWLMVMEFVRGETLERVVEQSGALAPDRAAEICMQCLGALAHAHSMGVVHRDLKPANIMLTEAGVIKIMDFGIARVAGTEHLTSAGFMMGTPAYMAPEQVLGHEIDARADLYAIGVVFYQLIAGTLPFKGDTPFQMAQSRISDEPTPVAAVRGDLPPWVREVLDVALARDPGARFQTALAFREALKRGLSGLPIGRSTPEAVPAELVTTAPPRSLPVLDPAADVTSAALPVVTPQPVPRPQAVVPTVAASPPARPPAPRAAGRRTTTLVAVAAIVVVVGLAAIWARSRAQARPVEPPPAARASAAGTDNAATRSDVMLPSPDPARPEAAAREAGAVGVAAATGSEAGGVPAAATGPAPSPDGPPPGNKRGRIASKDAAVLFRGLRSFRVTGKNVDEDPAELKFGAGRVSVLGEKDGVTYASLPYGEVTSAVYVKAKNPKWYPTLAGPAADVDLPGGLFRGNPHWLALQSRSSYLIVRLNDDNWRRVLDTVTERTGLKVDILSSDQ